MSSELVVIETQAQMLARVGIMDDGKSLSSQIRTFIKGKGLKGADAKSEYYRILDEVVSPTTAAMVDRAKSAGWKNEVRINKANAQGEVTRFSVTYFKPAELRAKYTKLQIEDMVKKFGRAAVLKAGIQIPEDVRDVTATVEPAKLEEPAAV